MTTPPMGPKDPQLATWYDDIDQILAETRSVVDGLSPEQLSWRPGPGKWSIAECLEHLTITAEKGAVYQRQAIEAARAAGRTGPGPGNFGLLGGWFVKTVGPQPTKAFKTPSVFAPASDLRPGEVVAAFEATQRAVQALYLSADGIDLGRVKARSAASALLRFNLATWFASIVAHERRHLEQAKRVRTLLSTIPEPQQS